MDWHDQKWSSVGYVAGFVAYIVHPGMSGFLIGWFLTAVFTAVGG